MGRAKPLQALAHGLRLSHSRTVRVIDRLEAEGLAARRPDPGDGRSVHVGLTPAGEAVARRVLAARAEVLQDALAPLAPDDREALARLAEQVLEGFITGRRHAAATCRMCDAHACGHYEGRCPVTRGADRAGEASRPLRIADRAASVRRREDVVAVVVPDERLQVMSEQAGGRDRVLGDGERRAASVRRGARRRRHRTGSWASR